MIYFMSYYWAILLFITASHDPASTICNLNKNEVANRIVAMVKFALRRYGVLSVDSYSSRSYIDHTLAL